MKKILLLLLAAILIGGCSNKPKAEVETTTEAPETAIEWTVVKLDVEGMTCEGCENAIKAGVESLEGIAGVESSFEEGWTEVKYDASSTSVDDIKGKITDTGYTVKDEI
jgi:copper chaperone